ncbi:MAG: DUF2550 domain-containing protein [Nocardioides sp.]
MTDRMPWWQWMLDAFVVVVLATLCYGLALVVRRRLLSRHGGTFEVSYRPASATAESSWMLGLGRYTDDHLEWFRIFSLARRPKRTWPRRQLTFASRRHPGAAEQISLYADHVVVTCELPTEEVELAMSPSSLMGFQSWLESGPPRPPVAM